MVGTEAQMVHGADEWEQDGQPYPERKCKYELGSMAGL